MSKTASAGKVVWMLFEHASKKRTRNATWLPPRRNCTLKCQSALVQVGRLDAEAGSILALREKNRQKNNIATKKFFVCGRHCCFCFFHLPEELCRPQCDAKGSSIGTLIAKGIFFVKLRYVQIACTPRAIMLVRRASSFRCISFFHSFVARWREKTEKTRVQQPRRLIWRKRRFSAERPWRLMQAFDATVLRWKIANL